jgi:hypothetical protein
LHVLHSSSSKNQQQFINNNNNHFHDNKTKRMNVHENEKENVMYLPSENSDKDILEGRGLGNESSRIRTI